MSDEAPGAAAQKLEELGLRLGPDIDYDFDKMFPKLTGWGAKGEIKQKHKLITLVEPLLRRLLRPNERVLYVAKGVQSKFSEQYFLGAWGAALINQTVFVLTNVRLLTLHSDTKGKPQHQYWMIFYNQIKKFKGTWTGTLALDLNDGLKLRFSGFRGTDRKQMPEIFQGVLDAYVTAGFNPSVTQSRENLCSHCLTVVPKDQYVCPSCGEEFWRPMQLALRSLVFPSWGDFTMRHTTVACLELFGYIVTWLMFVSFIIEALGDPARAIVVTAIFLVSLAIEHSVDAALTYHIAKKGLNAKRRPA